MTLAHVAGLHFDGKKEMAKKRVQKLKAAGFVGERPRRTSSPSVLFLSHHAFALLQEEGQLAEYAPFGISNLDRRAHVADAKLNHEIEVMDVKTAMVLAIRATRRYHIANFSTWPAAYQFKACRPDGGIVDMYPDGLLRVEENRDDGRLSEHAFFLEIDRSTESLNVIADKCHCYVDYYRSGRFAERNGAPADDYRQYPFRVLFICKSQQRMDNVARRLLTNDPPIRHQVYLATFADTIRDPLRAIWTTPADYLAVSNDAFKDTLRLVGTTSRNLCSKNRRQL